jgi:hypothetical protein
MSRSRRKSSSGSDGLEERLHFVAGDFFEAPLPSADVYILGHLLHDW